VKEGARVRVRVRVRVRGRLLTFGSYIESM
jgi:hypothetical protein